jgi:hypothetical protein
MTSASSYSIHLLISPTPRPLGPWHVWRIDRILAVRDGNRTFTTEGGDLAVFQELAVIEINQSINLIFLSGPN